MPDATIQPIDAMETFYDGLVVRTRASLGITSWGMQIFNLPPNFDQYPNHHHGEGAVDPGQEELYLPFAGSATIHLDDEQHRLEPGIWARVGISQLRRIVPEDDGFRFLAIGGTPGKEFEPPGWTELGAAPPQMPE